MSAWRITLLFSAFGVAWILGSDRALEFIALDVERLTLLQSLKGLAFVVLSALLIHALSSWADRRHRTLNSELERQRDRLARLLDVTPAAIYTLVPDAQQRGGWRTDFVSPNIERLTGHAAECWMGDSNFWRDHLHPEDRDRVIESQRRLFETTQLHHEYRIRHADGRYRWMADTLRLLRDEAGQPILITGAWLDVTERHSHEERGRVIEHVFESAAEGIFITDAQARILSVNRTFTRVTGYTLDEVEGKTPSVLKSGRQDRAFYADMWRQLLETGHWEGEMWNRRKSGEIYPASLTISAIRNDAQQLVQYLAVFTETSGSKQAEERIRRLANHDSLTDLPNRALLADRARIALAAAARQHQPVAVMHLNIDHFSTVNESLGHEAGDQVLRILAGRLSNCLKPDDTLCRLGGDDFILLLPGTSVHDVAQVSLRLMEAVAEPVHLGGTAPDLQLGASIGVALYPENGLDLNPLSRAAESAVHLAKREGRHTVRVASRELQQHVQETLLIASDLRWAISRGELRLHYQAQVDAQTRRLIGAEALVRWQHPQRGLISPGVFIPVAEETGLIQDIGLWVLREAVRQNMAWHAAGLPIVPVAINLSAAQFRHPDLVDTVARTLHEHQLPAELLELELTESVAMENSDLTLQTIAALKRLGVRLSIDDFGTGYSSLAYLKRYAVDKLKIDQSFVRGLNRDPQDEAIVTTIIGLASHLGLRTVAEGVETAEQASALQRMGCNELQGYHFHRPADAASFEQRLRSEVASHLARHMTTETRPAPLDSVY